MSDRTICTRQQWDREEVHKVFDACSSECCASGCTPRCRAPEPEAEAGFDVEGGRLGPDEVGLAR